jgi:putative Ca2+/H+ antiporter (TMEM165/GDT1 family)
VELLSIFASTFLLVFIGELGDKTQIATGTGTLANRGQPQVVFFSSTLALVTVAGLTVFFAGLIPPAVLPQVQKYWRRLVS